MLRTVNGPIRTLVRHGIEIRKQAPTIGDYCETPWGRRVTTECGYESQACRGDTYGCIRCCYTYCEQHFRTHVRRFQAPKQAWLGIMKRLDTELDKCAASRGVSPIVIHVPENVHDDCEGSRH